MLLEISAAKTIAFGFFSANHLAAQPVFEIANHAHRLWVRQLHVARRGAYRSQAPDPFEQPNQADTHEGLSTTVEQAQAHVAFHVVLHPSLGHGPSRCNAKIIYAEESFAQ